MQTSVKGGCCVLCLFRPAGMIHIGVSIHLKGRNSMQGVSMYAAELQGLFFFERVNLSDYQSV